MRVRKAAAAAGGPSDELGGVVGDEEDVEFRRTPHHSHAPLPNPPSDQHQLQPPCSRARCALACLASAVLVAIVVVVAFPGHVSHASWSHDPLQPPNKPQPQPQPQPATNATTTAATAPSSHSPPSLNAAQCKQQVGQSHTRFSAPVDVAIPVCCQRSLAAEPRHLFRQHFLFETLRAQRETTHTFYDTACNQALFVAPRRRSFGEWVGESVFLGFPAFRTPEVVQGPVVVNETTQEVWSVCGTFLGHREVDSKGELWVVNMVCVAGYAPHLVGRG